LLTAGLRSKTDVNLIWIERPAGNFVSLTQRIATARGLLANLVAHALAAMGVAATSTIETSIRWCLPSKARFDGVSIRVQLAGTLSEKPWGDR
jgi:hypothetical protein